MRCLEQITAECEVIGFDVVELAPIENFHAADFAAALLTYKLMGMVARKG